MIVKTCITLLFVSLLSAALYAQETPPTSAATASQTEEMRRALREALNKAATQAVATNAATAQAAPPAQAPADVTPPAGTPAAPAASPTLRPVPSRTAIPNAPGAIPPAPNVNRTVTPPGATPAGQPRVTPAPGTGPAAAPAAAAPPQQVVLPAVPPPAVTTTAEGLPDPDQIIPAGTLQVQNMPLDQFFELYSLISGRTVLRPNALAVGQNTAITLKAQTDWTRKEAVFAMDSALALNNVSMIPVDEKFVKAVAKTDAPTEGSQLGNLSSGNFSASDEFVTQIVELKALRPTELAQLLTTFSKVPNGITAFDNNNTLVIRDHAMNVKRMMEVIHRVDVVKEPDYKLEVIPIRFGRVEDFFVTMNSLVSGSAGGGGVATTTAGTTGVAAGASRTSRSSRMGRQQSSAYSQGGMYGNQPGMGNRAGLSPQQTTGANTVGGNQSSFQNRLNQIVARAARGTSAEEVEVLEDAKIVPDPKSNTLLIYAHKRDLAMITNIVAKLDVMQAQVLIEAVVFEISLGDSLNLGVSMAQSPKRFGQDFTGAGGVNNGQPLLNNLTNFPNALPSGMSYFGKIGQDLDVTFQAIAANSDVNVVSRPRIQTSHAIPGAFFVGEQIPYPSASTYDYGFYGGGVNSSPYQRSQINYLDVGFNLNVTPYITPEGYVVMEIVQEFSNKTRDVLIDSNPIPSVAQRSAEATLTVRDGQTIMLGGFISERKSKSKSGVPLLKDIPGLGALFRSSNNQNDRTELVVLMRARVLHTPEQAYEVAEQEKATLLGVQNAEREMEKSDEKRRRKMKK